LTKKIFFTILKFFVVNNEAYRVNSICEEKNYIIEEMRKLNQSAKNWENPQITKNIGFANCNPQFAAFAEGPLILQIA
jgi:hypothetical protein